MPKQRTEYKQEGRRRLRQGFLWSLAAHVLVLGMGFSLPHWPDGAGTALIDSRLNARLHGPVAEPATALPAAPTSKPSSQANTSTRVVSTVASAGHLRPDALAVPPAPTFSAAPTTPTVAFERKQSLETATSSVQSEQDSAGLDANALRGYRLALAIEARRFKSVPDQAQAEGWAGTADVRLAIAAGGREISVELAKSSGHAALDTAALSMIDAAAQRALVPPLLQQRAFVLNLPVVFKAAESGG